MRGYAGIGGDMVGVNLENNVNLSEESLTIIIIIVVLISQRKNYINTNPWYNLISYNLK